MPSVRVKENEPFEVALRRFKRTIEKTGLLTELRAREFYEKPSCCACRLPAGGPDGGCGRRFAFRASLKPRHPHTIFNAMTLRATIQEDMKAAMRSREADRLAAIRLLWSAVKQREVDERKELVDAEVTAVIDRMIKQRRDSIAQFEQGGRADLAAKEQQELAVLQAYMPQALSQAEVDAEIADAIASVVASTRVASAADMGKVMAVLKPRLAGRTDLAKVSAAVKARLAQPAA